MPSVFKLSLSTKRTRPCTLDGNPLMISTDAVGCGLLLARRTDVPAGRSVNVCGAQINPASALAATTAGETKYNPAPPSPLRPLEIQFLPPIAGLPFSFPHRRQPPPRPPTGGLRSAPASPDTFSLSLSVC